MTHTAASATLASIWTPVSATTTHAGLTLGNTTVFFAPPPADIGNVLSADSTLGANPKTKKRDGYATYLNWFQTLLLTFLAGFLSWLILLLVTGAELVSVIVGVAVGVFTFWRTFETKGDVTPATCTYVGSRGIAQYVWDDDEGKRQTPQTLGFQDVAELRTLETRHFVKNAYQHTTYIYQWSEGSQTAFVIKGLYRSPQGLPSAKDRYHFALAAEKAWTLFRMERALEALLQGNSVVFEVHNGDTITLTNDAIELRRRGESVRVAYQDGAKLSVNQGVMTLSSNDSQRSFFGSKGVYTFNYHDVANAQLLLLLFNTVTKE